MLTELQITNFAIIENQSLHFGAGLNVISGETGSGKSIILNALELILGGRSSVSYIRSGCDALEVQAHFDLSTLDPATFHSLPDIARNEELVITRSLNQSGKGKVYINGNLGTVSLLNEIASRLIALCSQNQQIRLLDATYHLTLLDGFIGDDRVFVAYHELYSKWSEKKRSLVDLEKNASDREARLIWLEETIAELTPLGLKSSLRSELEIAVKRLSSLQKIQNLTVEVQDALSAEDGVTRRLGSSLHALQEVEKLDPSIATVRALIHSARNEITEAEVELRRYLSTIEGDDQSYADLSEKLTTLARLERKHKTDTSGLCELLESAKNEIGALSKSDGMQKLREEVSILEAAMMEAAKKITKLREVQARKLEKLVIEELAELNMKECRFVVSFTPTDPGPRGSDKVEFLIAPNKGEKEKSLRQVASGGELSRITLVLKKILRDSTGVNVLVFDEVDTGVSGAVARAVGEKLEALASNSQVICITHLAQVASLADTHLLVTKSSKDRTVTSVRTLTKTEQIDEVARMLSGFEITKAARDTAKSLMKKPTRAA